MTKKFIGAAVALVLILALTGALYLLNRPVENETEESSTVEVLYVLGSATPVPAKSVTVSNEHGSYTVNVEDGDGSSGKAYSLDGLEGLPAAKTSLALVADNAAKLVARSLVSGDGNLSIYGLDKPSVTVDATLTDGSKQKLLIGTAAPGNEGYYVTADSKNIYLVTASSLTNYFYRDMDFMDKVITYGDPASDTFVDATLAGSVREEPIAIKQAAEVLDGMYSTHQITAPFYADLDSYRGLPAIQSVYGLTADSVAAVASTDSVLEKYGLREPYSTITVKAPDELGYGTFTLSASRPDAEGNVNLRISTSKLIYVIPASSLQWLELQYHDLMSKLAILPHIDKLAKVVLETSGEAYAFDLGGGEGDELTVAYNGSPLSTDIFRKFYQSLLSASYDSVAEEGLPENLSPILTYTYYYKDFSRAPDVVKFYEGPARKAYIVVNDNIPFLTPIAYLDKVLADIPKVIAGESITPYL